MKQKIIVIMLILFTLPIYSFEIVLENGDAFICDLISETDKSFKILYKDKEYTIPKTEVTSTDSTKKGTHSAFRYAKFTLKDGSKLNGVIAEESNDSYTLKTELGFLVVEKKELQSFHQRLEQIQKFLLPTLLPMCDFPKQELESSDLVM